jgi:hypothetical protein
MILCIKSGDDSRCNRRTTLNSKTLWGKARRFLIIRKKVPVTRWPVRIFLIKDS